MSSGAYPCQGCGKRLCPHPTEQCERGAAVSEILRLKKHIDELTQKKEVIMSKCRHDGDGIVYCSCSNIGDPDCSMCYGDHECHSCYPPAKVTVPINTQTGLPWGTCDICDEKPATRCDECTVNLIRLLDDHGLGQKEETMVDNLRTRLMPKRRNKTTVAKCDKIVESILIILFLAIIAYVVIK